MLLGGGALLATTTHVRSAAGRAPRAATTAATTTAAARCRPCAPPPVALLRLRPRGWGGAGRCVVRRPRCARAGCVRATATGVRGDARGWRTTARGCVFSTTVRLRVRLANTTGCALLPPHHRPPSAPLRRAAQLPQPGPAGRAHRAQPHPSLAQERVARFLLRAALVA